jgi:hypothetical protein
MTVGANSVSVFQTEGLTMDESDAPGKSVCNDTTYATVSTTTKKKAYTNRSDIRMAYKLLERLDEVTGSPQFQSFAKASRCPLGNRPK